MAFPENLYVGTCSWSSPDWLSAFYPTNLQPSQFLEYYSGRFRTVEIDATFYNTPNPAMVAGWREKTPPGFVFAAKIPKAITHDKVLRDCQAELTTFLKAITPLGDKLGPLLFQFPYFNRDAFASREQFDKLLRPFLKTLPKDFHFALEIRNKNWLSWDFLELLRDHSVAFTLIAQAWMPGLDKLTKALDVVTGPVCYVRFLGDRKAVEKKTRRLDKIVEDKTEEMTVWAKEIKDIANKGTRTYTFFSKYYAGFAPGSVKLFEDIWDRV